MGYAIFTSRKLSLQTKINNLNCRLSAITNEQNALTEKSAMLQNIMNIKSAKENSALATEYAQGTLSEADYKAKCAQLELDKVVQQSQIEALTNQENALDTSRMTLETQLQEANAELESAKKAEGDAIKNSAPNYVG